MTMPSRGRRRLTDPQHPYVASALQRVCPICKAGRGEKCGWPVGRYGYRQPLTSGIVHDFRIPENVLWGAP